MMVDVVVTYPISWFSVALRHVFDFGASSAKLLLTFVPLNPPGLFLRLEKGIPTL